VSDRETAVRADGRAARLGRALIVGQLLLVTAIWGGGFVAAKLASSGLPPVTAATLRTLIAALIFVPAIWLPKRYRPTIRRGDWLTFGVLSVLGYSMLNVVYFAAFRLTNVTQASLIWGAVPIVTAVLAALLVGERLTRWVVAGVVFTTVGVAAVVLAGGGSSEGGANPPAGNLLIGLAMVLWVLYSLLAKVTMRRFTPLVVTGTSCTLGAITLVPVALVTDWDPALLSRVPTSAWLGILYSGGISLVISYVLWIDGVRRIGATRVAVFTNLSPVWALVFAAWLLGEQVLPLHLAGGALIIAGVWLANRRSDAPSRAGADQGQPPALTTDSVKG
jgi:drug/metabolite transporter (DMT)-like permease